MPPLGMHMTVARELAAELNHAAVQAEPGAYYLGATTPDIRVVTKWDRAKTHFFDLKRFEHQSGVEALFREYPELASPERLSPKAGAFMCGYISHLEMDEAWICEVYRPCFGVQSPLGGDLLADLLDRVLQFELDRRLREDTVVIDGIRRDVLGHTVEETIAFIERDTLAQWQERIAELLAHQPDWERFRSNVGRHLRSHSEVAEDDLERLLRDIPDLLDQSLRQVTPARVEAFEERSRQRALAAMRTYLS